LTFTVLQALFEEKSPFSWTEVAVTSILSIIVAFVASYINSHKLINKIGQKLSVTARYDDADVWECFNDEFKSKWVYVRDHKLNLLYYGWINLYSDSEKPRELLLIDVKVYNNLSGEYLYSCDMLYVAREKSELSIEIPKVEPKSLGSSGNETLISRKDDTNVTRPIEQRTPGHSR
jgi:heme exporter protein D